MSDPPSRALYAGRVGRAHGLDGSFYVTEARPRLLRVGTPVQLAGRRRELQRVAGVPARPIVRLEGIEDRGAAAAVHGGELSVELGDAPPLQAGEWWAHELQGCEVFDEERRIGAVVDLLELPSCEALQVRDPDGRELFVPMVKDAIRLVDVAAGRIEVNMAFLGEQPVGEQSEGEQSGETETWR